MWKRLFQQLSAIEVLHVGDHARPRLNERGRRVLHYLRRRYRGPFC